MTIPTYIREQPAALDRCLAAAQTFGSTWAPSSFDGIALVGAGSSFNALQVARPAFVAARRGPVLVHEPQDFLAEIPDLRSPPLVIVLSQSGASTSAIEAARAAVTAGCITLALTAVPQSPLASTGAQLLHLPVGDEPVGPKTKGFIGSMAMLFKIAEALGGPRSQPLTGSQLEPVIDLARAAAADLVPTLEQVDVIAIAGRRANHGIALEASLKIAEMAGIPSVAWPTEELLHGRLHGFTRQSVVFVIGEGADELWQAHRVRAVMRSHACRVIVVDPAGDHWPGGMVMPEGPWGALGLILPFQWLAVLLAEQRGFDPAAMRYGALSRELAIKTDVRR